MMRWFDATTGGGGQTEHAQGRLEARWRLPQSQTPENAT